MTRYEMDPSKATVVFNGSSSLHAITARARAAGWLDADIAGNRFRLGSELAGRVEVKVTDIRTGNPLFDTETRRRIDTASHPLIVAEITGTRANDGTTVSVVGTVSFNGKAVPLEGEVTLAPGRVLTGGARVDVRWWGLAPPRLLTLRVHPEVLVAIDLPLLERG